MKTLKCDLHMHSNCSDGIFTPEDVVQTAKLKGLDCIALTDHDTFCGVERAMAKAKEVGIKFVVGAELSTVTDREIHILAFGVDFANPECQKEMEVIAGYRHQRNLAMLAKLAEYGMPLEIDRLKKEGGSVGRGVMAREMVRLGYCSSVAEVFEKYLSPGMPCYVSTRRLTPQEAIHFTLKYGGIPVLAHPKQLHIPNNQFEKFLKPLVLCGLGGIEAEYFTHTIPERNFYRNMAKKYKLITTGGSDFHDHVHGVELGTKSFSPSGYTRTILGI